MALCGELDRRPHREEPVDHRLHQLPSPGRAAHGPPQRGPCHPARPGTGARIQSAGARRCAGSGDGQWRQQRCRAPARARPSRIGEQRGTRTDRGRPQVRPPAVCGGHEQSRTRHRHGCCRSGHPGGGPTVGGQRIATHRSCRAPGGRDQSGCAVPQAPHRSAAVCCGGRADDRRTHRRTGRSGQSARRTGATDRRGVRDGQHRRRRVVPNRPAQCALRHPAPSGL